MVVIDQQAPDLAPAFAGLVTEADERAARRALLDQIARLERRLADAVVSGFPRTTLDTRVRAAGPARLLDLAELEVLRDQLAARLSQAHHELDEAGLAEAEARVRLEGLLADPRKHRFQQVRREDLGLPGCGAYQSRPRLGIIGMLMGWWHVKLSSGCPLGSGPTDGQAQPQARRFTLAARRPSGGRDGAHAVARRDAEPPGAPR